MKGKIGGATRMVTAKAAGCTFKRDKGAARRLAVQKRLRQITERLRRDFDAAPRLRRGEDE